MDLNHLLSCHQISLMRAEDGAPGSRAAERDLAAGYAQSIHDFQAGVGAPAARLAEVSA